TTCSPAPRDPLRVSPCNTVFSVFQLNGIEHGPARTNVPGAQPNVPNLGKARAEAPACPEAPACGRMAAFPGPAAVAGAALKWYVESMKTDMDLLAAVKPGFTTISPSRAIVASFDREGRLFSFVEGGLTYRRTLASEVEVRRRDEESRLGGRAPRLRRRLGRAETLAVFARALETAAAVRPLAAGELRRRLEEEILPWTPEALLAEAERFRRVYKPISILPPDQYLSVVLQATEGCTWHRCTCCTFYQDRPFHVKSEDEFQRHVDEVRAFLGRGVLMRKSVFLGDGNALALTQRRLVPLF